MIARIHNVACVNCSTCIYFLLKQTDFDIFLRSAFNKFADFDKSHTVENLADNSKFSGRSSMYIKKSSGLNIDP